MARAGGLAKGWRRRAKNIDRPPALQRAGISAASDACISRSKRGHCDVPSTKPPEKRRPSIEFSVVSGSNENMIVECLESLRRSLEGLPYDWRITAICNTPRTDLPERLEKLLPGIRIIRNPAPLGFASNHNLVLRESTADYVWVLNDDLVFGPETVSRVVEYMEAPENSRVAVVSPRLLNTDGSLQPSTYSFPSIPQTLLSHSGIREHRIVDRLLARAAPLVRPRTGSSRFWSHDRTIEVDTLRGACVAVRMTAAREVGPMAEVALVGAEELDWHRRFRQAGWKVVFLAEASIVHHGSQSVAHSSEHRPEYLKGTLHYFRVGTSRASYLLLCGSLLSMFAARLGSARLRGDAAGAQVARRCIRVIREAL